MLRSSLMLALVLFAAEVVSGQGRSGRVDEVLALNARLEAAVAGGDAAAMAAFLGPEFRLQNSANRIVTAEQVLEQVRSGAIRFAAYDRRIEAAYEAGDVVVLMGEEKVRPAVEAGRAGPLVTRRFTSVWRQTPAGWRQIARQSTNVAPVR